MTRQRREPARPDDLRPLRDSLVRFCWGYLGRIQDAEDAAQEVLRKGLANDDELSRAWYFRVARNHCLNCLRLGTYSGREASMPASMRLAGSLTSVRGRLARAEVERQVSRVFAGLSNAEQEVLRLRYCDGMSRDLIAEVVEVPVSVVKSRLRTGLARLRDDLAG